MVLRTIFLGMKEDIDAKQYKLCTPELVRKHQYECMLFLFGFGFWPYDRTFL